MDNSAAFPRKRETVLGMLIAIGLGVALGASAGWGARRLLAGLRRGVTLRPPVLELCGAATTGLGVALVWPSVLIGLAVWAGLLTVTLGAVDIAAHRLPDALTLPAIPFTAVLVAATWLADPTSGRPVTALAAALVVTGLFWVLAALSPKAMGRGDVKLVPSLALMVGYLSVAAVLCWLMIAFVLGAAIALVGLLTRRLSMGSAIPFGPCLLVGCWVTLAVPQLTTL